MITAQTIFKGLPENKRKSIINLVINTQGLKSPRPKSFKERDSENFGKVKHGNFLPALFDVCVKQHLN